MLTRCPFCGQSYEVDNQYVGQKIECQVCKKEFIIKKIMLHTNRPAVPASAPRNPPMETQKKESKTKKKWMWLLILFVLLAVPLGVYYYNYRENQETIVQYEADNKKIMKEALLDFAKFPGSCDVCFESYHDFPFADFITADGYIDMPNGFGVKQRYKFRFHITEYGTRNRFFFSLYGGQKFIKSKEDLGQICLEDSNGGYHFIQAKDTWRYNTRIRK